MRKLVKAERPVSIHVCVVRKDAHLVARFKKPRFSAEIFQVFDVYKAPAAGVERSKELRVLGPQHRLNMLGREAVIVASECGTKLLLQSLRFSLRAVLGFEDGAF